MTELPRLAFVFHPSSFPTLLVREAAERTCQLVWVVDRSVGRDDALRRLLARFGPVVDVAGLGPDRAAEAIAAERPDGILSLHDDQFAWTSRVALRLGLPFHSPETVRLLTDKHLQRVALRADGLRVPGFVAIPPESDQLAVRRLSAQLAFPAVIKPRYGKSSRDTLPVSSPDEACQVHAQFRLRYGDGEEYVLEEYIPDAEEQLCGPGFANYVSVEGVVSDGRITNAGITGRTPPAFPFRETGFFTPAALDQNLVDDLLQTASQAAEAVGVTNGVLHTEIKITPDGPVVIEVNGRPGGGMSEILERTSGFNLLRASFRIALGQPHDLDGPVPCSHVSYLLYVHSPAEHGRISAVEGLDELADLPGVDSIELVRGPGHVVDWRDGNMAHVFRVWGSVQTHDRLREVVRFATEDVRITSGPVTPVASRSVDTEAPVLAGLITEG